MYSSKSPQLKLLKEKIYEKSVQYLDLLFDLLPENSTQAENILQLMEELIKEKKLNRHVLYRHMEKPIYFQDESGQDFTKRDPLIAKIVREGGLSLFNYYLKFKYGSPLSSELIAMHDIFIFNLAPIKNYIDKTNWPVFADKEEKARITEKYYAVYGMSYELLGDIFQEKNNTILKRLIECQFDFNSQNTIEHLKKYLYMNFDKQLQLTNQTIQLLLDDGLQPNSYLDVFLTGILDEFSMQNTVKLQDSLISLANFLLDHNATLSLFPREFIEKLQHILDVYTQKISLLPNTLEQQKALEEIWYLQGHFMEFLKSLEIAKPYFLKAGMRGVNAVRRKEMVNLLKVVNQLSNTE